MSLIKGETGEWEIVLGLEVHAQVISDAKLFSGAPTTFGADPNTQVSLVDAAMPGMLPVINARCVEQAVRTGLGLNAKINLRSLFDRKNYFYADLPQGYQISQFKDPIVGEGEVEIDLPDGKTRTIRVERLHLEQDAGKSMHDQHPSQTYVDLNRSGVALMEIVSKPDMRNADEAAAYLTKLRSIVRYLGTVRRQHGRRLHALRRERLRAQAGRRAGHALRDQERELDPLREAGHRVRSLPSGRPHRGRGQDHAGDAPVRSRPRRDALAALEGRRARLSLLPRPRPAAADLHAGLCRPDPRHLPELPDARKNRYIKDYGRSPYDAGVLTAEKETAEFFEAVAKGRDAKLAANLVTGDFFAMLNRRGATFETSPISAANLGKLLDLQADGTISGRIAKDLFLAMEETGKDPAALVEERGLKQVSDTGADRGRHQGGDRRQSRPARGLQGQAHAVRLVRRPGHEVDRRQGQPQGRERACSRKHSTHDARTDVVRARFGHFGAAARASRRMGRRA